MGQIEEYVRSLMQAGHGDHKIAELVFQEKGVKITRHGIRRMMQRLRENKEVQETDIITSIGGSGDAMEISGRLEVRSLERLLELAEVDLDTWYVDRWVANTWANNWQVKAWLKRRSSEERSILELIDDLKGNDREVLISGPQREPSSRPRALEISIADPHYGMRCFAGPSGDDWSPEQCENAWWDAYYAIIDRAHALSSIIDECVLVVGNDFLHADNVFHTTTQGTTQPEMESWHEMVRRGRHLLIDTIKAASKSYSMVRVIMVPGNHSRQTEYLLGLLLDAYFHTYPNVDVDCGPSPYKFWRFGTNLIGFDHGHSINPIKLGGIMAEECKMDWAHTTYREWHIGDQHRKGVSPPSMEELGVSIEYLPSLIPWNEWHKIKGFSQQKRAALGFLYDHSEGCIGKLQFNMNGGLE